MKAHIRCSAWDCAVLSRWKCTWVAAGRVVGKTVGEGRGVEGENESTVERVVGERVGEGGAAVRTALLALLWESQVGPAGAPAGGRAAPR